MHLRLAAAIAIAIAAAALMASAAPVLAQVAVPQSRPQVMLSFSPVVKASAPGVVNIYARKVVERRASPFAGDPFFERFFRGAMPRSRAMENSLGSGVIVSADGLVVSNFHVVGGASEIRVVLSDKREFDAEVLLADERSDLAVLRLKGASGLPALILRDSDEIEVGDLVLAIGNPFGVGQTVTSGIVSGLARTGGEGGRGSGYFIQTDAPINPGNSGGALVDMAGRLIGVNTAILTRSGGSNGIGFAVPANLVAQVIAQAEAGRSVLVQPWSGLNVQPVTVDLAQELGLARPVGVVIEALHPRSPFARAGMLQGDVLLEIDGHPIDSAPELEFRLAAQGIGGQVSVRAQRGEVAVAAEVALIAPPEDPPADRRRIDDPGPFMGLTVANLNPALGRRIGADLIASGVVVLNAPARARRAGWRPGDVLVAIEGRDLASTADLARLARGLRGPVEVIIERDGRRGALRFRP
jgi:Do/DeqQ family serine protease